MDADWSRRCGLRFTGVGFTGPGFAAGGHALRSAKIFGRRELFGFRSDSDLAQFAALKSSAGIGGGQYGIARFYPALVPVLARLIRFELDVWVAMHEDMCATPRVRLLFDHLAAELSGFLRVR